MYFFQIVFVYLCIKINKKKIGDIFSEQSQQTADKGVKVEKSSALVQ